jgi:hypothetical protein
MVFLVIKAGSSTRASSTNDRGCHAMIYMISTINNIKAENLEYDWEVSRKQRALQ